MLHCINHGKQNILLLNHSPMCRVAANGMNAQSQMVMHVIKIRFSLSDDLGDRPVNEKAVPFLVFRIAQEEAFVQNLADLCLVLAEAIFLSDGDGFPKPAVNVRASEAWNGCVRAAKEAEVKESAGTLGSVRYVVVWPEGRDGNYELYLGRVGCP